MVRLPGFHCGNQRTHRSIPAKTKSCVDEVVDGTIDPNEVLLSELGMGRLATTAPENAYSDILVENEDGVESEEDADEISAANVAELKQKVFGHFAQIEYDYKKLIGRLGKHLSQHKDYLAYRDADCQQTAGSPFRHLANRQPL